MFNRNSFSFTSKTNVLLSHSKNPKKMTIVFFMECGLLRFYKTYNFLKNRKRLKSMKSKVELDERLYFLKNDKMIKE